ncbi:Transcriptional regulator of competence genes, TfoX/Sxy family [Rhizobiales bacterium GAS113]|nr:Transcriptional regulator of competence genes, TfoX/Sxy family [Rhizobiales bacterium GAS113]
MSLDTARARALEIAIQLGSLGTITVSRFFGGAALLADGVQFAFVIKGSLYLRVNEESRPAFEALGAAPFSYAGRSKSVTVASYYEAPAEIVDDADELRNWAARSRQAALAALTRKPRPKRQRWG